MKRAILFLTIAISAYACTQKQADNTADNSSDTGGYAYTIARPSAWEWGDKNNIRTALNSLKAYETGNVSNAFKDYADTALIQLDGFEGRLTKDSLLTFFLRQRSEIKRMGIQMNDFESVRTKDGKAEYVSLWYKKLWQDNTGKIDSLECMDDVGFKNGKIILLNQKIRHFPQTTQ